MAPIKVSNTTPAAKPKVASTPQPKRGLVATRSETNANVAPPAGKGCNCFTAGTKVVTEDGEKNIEDIEVGDKVLAKDEKNADGELAYKEVEALYRNQRDDVIKLHVGDQIIETTDNHPFWVEGKGWVFADELKAGDQLQKADGTNLTIEKVEFIKLDEPVTVYNFTVEEYHTYYVTDIGIWVHNTQCSINGIVDSKEVKKLNEWLSDDTELLDEVTQWYNQKPEWWGIDPKNTDVFYRTPQEVKQIRSKPGESGGHHPHGLALGGPEKQTLTPTGETAKIKNPTHSQVTGLQRRVINRIKKQLK